MVAGRQARTGASSSNMSDIPKRSHQASTSDCKVFGNCSSGIVQGSRADIRLSVISAQHGNTAFI
jgi:hypothetical protein